MNQRENLNALLADGKTRQLIAQLRGLSAADPDLHAEVLQLSAQFAELERQTRLNTTDPKLLGTERNRITSALLSVIERLPQTAAPGGWFSGWRRTVAATGVVVVFGAAAFSGYSLHDLFFGKNNTDSVENTIFPLKNQPNETTLADPNNGPLESGQSSSGAITAPKSGAAKPMVPPSAPMDTVLRITCKTDRGAQNLRYKAGEDMRLFLSASQPCFVRVIYRLADGRLALLDDGRQITTSETGRFVQTGPDFTCEAPFGTETLYVFAQNTPFPPLRTETDPDGYTRITDALPEALQKTRGFKKKFRFAEDSLQITTFE